MNALGRQPTPRRLVVGLVAGLSVSGLLLAQAIDRATTASAPVQSQRVDAGQPATSTAPATWPATQPSPEEPAEVAARERLLSGLIGSKHDFTREGRLGRDLCLPCHTPHLAAAPPPRLDHRPATTQPLRPYQTLDVRLDGWSLLCLGCHDGVTAPDVYSGSHAVAIAGQLANSRLGTHGLRSHPVGIPYPLIQDGYEPRAAVESAGLMLPDGRIQCATCHDAHNTGRHASMLRVSDERSRMCLTCHRL